MPHALRTLALAVLAATALLAGRSPGRAAAHEPDEPPVIASFEGHSINLADGWGDATACASDPTGTRCYRTEAVMNAAEPDHRHAEPSPQAVCSTSLRLYSATGFGGSVLSLSTRGTYLNLSGFGFNNVTSSYRVGACSSTFFDGAGGGAPAYPGNTSAGASASSMLSGWDNRISSVRIN